jgi:prepilin-type N-terminal cleavage/methylation domain-containing protein
MNLAKDRQGFSLVEILIAMCVLSIAMMGLATLQVRCMRSNDLANRTTQAVALAQNQLEELIFRDAEGEHFAAGVTQDDENPVSVPGDDSGAIFTRSWEFLDDDPAPAARTIIVRVSWNDTMGQHRVEIDGVITTDSY